jgi:hypothetical protein
VYVANSEPAIWRRGAGRAVVAERVLISGEATLCEAGRDTVRLLRLTQGSPPALAAVVAKAAIKPNPRRRSRSGAGCEGWQIHGQYL